MKKLAQILAGFCLVLAFSTCIGDNKRFPKRTNIVVVVDVKFTNDNYTTNDIRKFLNGISLNKYRIALHSTNGITQKLINYQSRECSVKKLQLPWPRINSLSGSLFDGMREVLGKFYEDDNIFVVYTDRSVDPFARHILGRLIVESNNVGSFIINRNDVSGKYKLTRIEQNYTQLEGLKDIQEVLTKISFYKDNLKKCIVNTKKKYVYDECSRQCECINGTLQNCYRIRSSFSELPLKKRIHYINVYKKLATDPRYKEAFYGHLRVHPTVNFKVLHSSSQLLPFHRKFTLVFENFLRLVDCHMTIPYWNFAVHAKHLFKKVPGYHIWDSVGGFGSTKTHIERGFCVETGPFRYPLWKLPRSFVHNINEEKRFQSICEHDKSGKSPLESIKSSRCLNILRETFQPRCLLRVKRKIYKTPTYKKVYTVLNSNKTTFKQFEKFLRLDCHGSIHDDEGGDFGYGFSSFLPEFFPLHSMIDAMWDFWQKKGKGSRYMGHWQGEYSFKIIGFRSPRYFYLNNSNLERCGVKVKYTNIFPKKIKIDDKKKNNINEVIELVNLDLFNGFKL